MIKFNICFEFGEEGRILGLKVVSMVILNKGSYVMINISVIIVIVKDNWIYNLEEEINLLVFFKLNFRLNVLDFIFDVVYYVWKFVFLFFDEK